MFFTTSFRKATSMSDASDYEKQLTAMRSVMEALAPLDQAAKQSVFMWIAGQLGISPSQSVANKAGTQTAKRDGTVSVVAQRIGAKSARDLLTAAAAHLTLYQGKDSFTKDELVGCAKDARNWKSAYSNQMAFNIKRMLDSGELFEKSKNVFSLSDAVVAKLEENLK
jgi:hypothetical protein